MKEEHIIIQMQFFQRTDGFQVGTIRRKKLTIVRQGRNIIPRDDFKRGKTFCNYVERPRSVGTGDDTSNDLIPFKHMV